MLGGVAACDSGLDVQPAIVQWMEWPAEVVAAKPFSVHLLTGFPACHKWVFKSPLCVRARLYPRGGNASVWTDENLPPRHPKLG